MISIGCADFLKILFYRYNCCTKPASDSAYVAENVLNREFHSDKLNEKWVTDVSEFKYRSGDDEHKGKVYRRVRLRKGWKRFLNTVNLDIFGYYHPEVNLSKSDPQHTTANPKRRFIEHQAKIEIKKAESSGKTAIKNFDVLEPVTQTEAFGELEFLKVEIGTENVVFLANDLLPVNEKNWYVPVWLI